MDDQRRCALKQEAPAISPLCWGNADGTGRTPEPFISKKHKRPGKALELLLTSDPASPAPTSEQANKKPESYGCED
jgi:hypothetical protein